MVCTRLGSLLRPLIYFLVFHPPYPQGTMCMGQRVTGSLHYLLEANSSGLIIDGAFQKMVFYQIHTVCLVHVSKTNIFKTNNQAVEEETIFRHFLVVVRLNQARFGLLFSCKTTKKLLLFPLPGNDKLTTYFGHTYTLGQSFYRVTIQLVINLLLTSKQKFLWPGLAQSGQSGTFVLKSTGGSSQAEWSPCRWK